MSNPYYVWYHDKDKDLKAETLDGSDTPLGAEIGDYQEYTATPLEQQSPNFSISDGDPPLDFEADEGNLFALTGFNSQIEYDNGYDKKQDIFSLSSDAADSGADADDDNIFAINPAFADNGFDKLFTMSSAEEEEFYNPLIFFS